MSPVCSLLSTVLSTFMLCLPIKKHYLVLMVHYLLKSNRQSDATFAQSRCCHVTFYKNITLTKAAHFLKLYYSTPFQDPMISVANIAPVSQVCVSTMLLLLIVQIRRWSGLKWLNFCKFGQMIKKVNRGGTHTARSLHTPTFCHESNVTQTQSILSL